MVDALSYIYTTKAHIYPHLGHSLWSWADARMGASRFLVVLSVCL